jgi:murein L,D-transpeptidase YcbB/YkuD
VIKRRIVMGSVAASVAILATLGLGATADARVGAGWVGWGETNNAQAVWCTQTMLKVFGYYPYNVDSEFGQHTADAITNFQSDDGLHADGIVGAATGTAMLDIWSDEGRANGWGGYCGWWLPTTHN